VNFDQQQEIPLPKVVENVRMNNFYLNIFFVWYKGQAACDEFWSFYWKVERLGYRSSQLYTVFSGSPVRVVVPEQNTFFVCRSFWKEERALGLVEKERISLALSD